MDLVEKGRYGKRSDGSGMYEHPSCGFGRSCPGCRCCSKRCKGDADARVVVDR